MRSHTLGVVTGPLPMPAASRPNQPADLANIPNHPAPIVGREVEPVFDPDGDLKDGNNGPYPPRHPGRPVRADGSSN